MDAAIEVTTVLAIAVDVLPNDSMAILSSSPAAASILSAWMLCAGRGCRGLRRRVGHAATLRWHGAIVSLS
eukprot:3235484-Pleurochrysis_carterae.AAC.4